MLCKLMQCKIKTNKKILKAILTDFSRKEKVITRYARIYIKLNGRDNKKQAKTLFSLWSLNECSRNVVVSRRKKIVIMIIFMIVVKLIIIITIK